MVNVSLQNHAFTPILLGLIWGLIPCGFLYTAQIKAAETGNLGYFPNYVRGRIINRKIHRRPSQSII